MCREKRGKLEAKCGKYFRFFLDRNRKALCDTFEPESNAHISVRGRTVRFTHFFFRYFLLFVYLDGYGLNVQYVIGNKRLRNTFY